MQQVLLLPDFAYNDRFGWTLPQNLTRPDALQLMQPAAQDNQATNSTPEQQQQQLPKDLVQQLGPGYNGTLPVHYINSVWVCQQPSAACASQPNSTAQRVCLLQAYTQVNPDRAAAAADPGGNYGVQVVLPAVLASVGKHGFLEVCQIGFCPSVACVGRYCDTGDKLRLLNLQLTGAVSGPTISKSKTVGSLRLLASTPSTVARCSQLFVFCCAGGALLLSSLVCCLLAARRRHRVRLAKESLAAAKGPYDPAHSTPTQHRGGVASWLFGTSSSGTPSGALPDYREPTNLSTIQCTVLPVL